MKQAGSNTVTPISNASPMKQARHFNNFAADYDQLIDRKQVKMDTVLLCSYTGIQDGDLVLDMGTGTGKITLSLLREFDKLSVLGVDFSKNMLLLARKKSKEMQKDQLIECYMADFLKLPFKDSVFDLVLITYALHHVSSKLRINALLEAIRVLKRKGCVAILEVGKNHYAEALNAYFGSNTVAYRRFSIQDLEHLMTQAQLDLRCSIDRQEWYYLPLRHISNYLKVQGIVTEEDNLDSLLREKLSDPQKITIERLFTVGVKP